MKTRWYSQNFRSQLIKLIWIIGFWILVSMLQFLNGYATLSYFDYDMSQISGGNYFIGSIFTGLIAGIFGGSMMVFYWERWLRTKSYRKSLWQIFLSYSLIYLLVGVLSELYYHSSRLRLSVFHPDVWEAVRTDIMNLSILNSYFIWLFVVLITLIALLVNDKYGPGVFASFLMGRYFHPRREERIFMFLDLRSSTTIAEKLGEERYFNFLKQIFKDVTPAILNAKGEVYQYVGDEIVISWNVDSGSRNAKVLNCFFDIQKILKKKSDLYARMYAGVIPEFKAGLHYGHIMAGEIGVVKRDIAYSGDVLNTTARIQSKCNELGVDILISKYLIDKLGKWATRFEPRLMGEINLRGKQMPLPLYTL